MAESFFAGVRTFRRSLLAVLALAVASCSATGAVFQALTNVPANQGVVYIYRPDVFYAGGTAIRITLDGAFAAEVSNSGYLPLTLSPGSHTVNASMWPFPPSAAPLELNVTSGNSQYIRVTAKEAGLVPIVVVQRMDERVALSEIASLRLSE